MGPSLFEAIVRKSRTFARNEKMSRQALENMQLRKFRRLAGFAQRHSPYYAELIKARALDIRTCVPLDFPVLTKSELMANFDRIVTDRRLRRESVEAFIRQSRDPAERYLNEFFVVHTSGSSGEVGVFVFSRQDWARGLAHMGRHHAASPALERQKAATLNAADGHYAAISWTQILRQPPFDAYYDLLALEINSPLPSIVRELNAFQPNTLSGYVNGIKILAREQRRQVLHIAPREIALGGEVLSDRDKRWIEQSFGCPVVNYYACTEHMYMGRSLPGQSTLHLWEDDLLFELRRDHTIVTNLFNFTLPLIRYRMDDVLIPRNEKTSSWPYLEIEGLVGRAETPPVFLNEEGREDFISPHTINEIFVSGVARFQMQVLGKASFKFLVCLDPDLADAQRAAAVAGVKARLDDILARKAMANVTFEIVIAETLGVDTQTRKFRLIVGPDGKSPRAAR